MGAKNLGLYHSSIKESKKNPPVSDIKMPIFGITRYVSFYSSSAL